MTKEEGLLAVLWWSLVAVGSAYATSAVFYPALRTPPRVRITTFVVLAVLVALTPWMIPAEAGVVRLVVAVYAAVLVMKMWDLHLGAQRSVRPGWAEFLGFMANMMSLVHRRAGFERQPTPRENRVKLSKAVFEAFFGLAAFALLSGLDWESAPFLVEHVLKATAFFVFISGGFTASAALVRVFGGYVPDFSDRPLVATTPAEFWRRYNRCVGEFLREDLFRPIGGRRHPVRATLVVFAVSGLLHEYLFTVAVGQVQGFQLAFFLVQGAAVALTLRAKPNRIVGVAATFTFNALTSILFFASVEGVLPFYEGGLPGWLW